MTLKAVVNSLDDVPENLRDEYTEVTGRDGKKTFHLDLDATISTHTSILPLANSLKNAKTEKQQLQTRVTELEAKIAGLPDDFDATAYQTVLTELENLKKGGDGDKDTETRLQGLRDQYEQRLRDAEAKRTADLAAKDAEIAELNSELDGSLVGSDLSSALDKAGIDPRFKAATTAMLKGVVKSKKDGDKRHTYVETDLGEVPVEQYVKSWSETEDGKPFVKPASGGGGKGSGNGGGNEANPWVKETRNMTRQGEIVKNDPAKAERMMKAAGISQTVISQTLSRV